MLQSRHVFRWAIAGPLLAVLMGSPLESAAQTTEDALRLSQRYPAVGARTLALGIRGFAGLDDYSAMHGNPAGLGFIERSRFVGSFAGLETTDLVISHTSGFDSDQIEHGVEQSGLNALAYVYDFPVQQGSLVAALGFSQKYGFSREFSFGGVNNQSTISTSFLPFAGEYLIGSEGDLAELNDLPFAAFNGGMIEFFPTLYEFGDYPFLEAVVPGTVIKQEGRLRESGNVYEGSGGGAIEVREGVMVGVSANVTVGEYRFSSNFNEIDEYGENGFDDYNVLLDDGTLLEGFDELVYRQRLESDFAGFNLRAGVSAELGDHLRLGLSLETPTWTYVEESYGTEFTTWFDDGGMLSYGERADDAGNGYFEYNLRSPWRVGGGAYLTTGGLGVTVEAELVDWSQLTLSSPDDGGLFDEVNAAADEHFGAAINTAAGIEYEFGRFVVRTGYAHRPDAYKQTLTDSRGDVLSRARTYYSFGVGFRINSRWRVDMGGIATTHYGKWVAYPEDAAGPRQDLTLEFDETVETSRGLLEVTYRF